MTNISPGRLLVFAVGILITSRVTCTSKGSFTPVRKMVRLTLVPFGPRISWTASSVERLEVVLSPTLIILSPAISPALDAGEFLSGAMTVIAPSCATISIPTPSKLPRMSDSNISDSTGGKNTVYGSPSESAKPSIAPQTFSSPFTVLAVVLAGTYFSLIRFQAFQNGAKSTSKGRPSSVFSIPTTVGEKLSSPALNPTA